MEKVLMETEDMMENRMEKVLIFRFHCSEMFCFSFLHFRFIVGSNVRKRRFYSNDLKVVIYLELLAHTTPPVLHHGVSRAAALKFGVPQRIVQKIWRRGQDGGIEGVVNKYAKNCGWKRIEVPPDALKSVNLSNRAHDVT